MTRLVDDDSSVSIDMILEDIKKCRQKLQEAGATFALKVGEMTTQVHCKCGLFVGDLTPEQFELHKKKYCPPMIHCVCGLFVGDWSDEKLKKHKDQCRLYQKKQNGAAGLLIDKEITTIGNVSEEKPAGPIPMGNED